MPREGNRRRLSEADQWFLYHLSLNEFPSGELGMPGPPGEPLEHVPWCFQHLGLFLSVCLQQELSPKAPLVFGVISFDIVYDVLLKVL